MYVCVRKRERERERERKISILNGEIAKEGKTDCCSVASGKMSLEIIPNL